ncbi:MAG: hypothetical protein GH151_00005, partial [Bacteroidetes bacterium]|nr:hypothetical protein [Bacteroidota bacterium]
MSNYFYISLKHDISVAVSAIYLNNSLLNFIRGTDVVNIQSNINDNETKIDTAITNIGTANTNIATLLAIPYIENTTPLSAKTKITLDVYETVVSVSPGSGFLTGISGCFYVAGNDNLDVKVTIDGTVLTGEHMLLNISNSNHMSSGFSYIA